MFAGFCTVQVLLQFNLNCKFNNDSKYKNQLKFGDED
jgi:hypothetical protein